MWHEKIVAIDATEHYQKGGLRNRCYIAGPNGVQRLSIPLEKGKHQQTPIREVRISYEIPWQRQHWRSLQAAYGNAPYFEHYADDICAFFERKWVFLFDLNTEIQVLVLKKKLGWAGEFVFQNEFVSPNSEKRYKAMMYENRLAHRPYPQVFQDRHRFQANLSVLDLLFCCGKTGMERVSATGFWPP